MKKEFLSNIFLILGLNLLIKPFYVLFIDAEVQNIVGPEAFGLYFALFNFSFLLQFFLDFGIQNFNSQYIASNRDRFESEFHSILGTKVLLTLCFYLVLIIGFFTFGFPLLGFKIVLLIGAQIIALSFLLFIRGNISALGYFRADSILSSLDKFILVILLGWLLYFSEYRSSFEILHFLYAQIFSTVLTLIVAIAFLYYKKLSLRIKISFSYSKQLLKKSYPFALVLLLMSLYTRMDGVMLERFIDDNGKQAGIYASGYRIMDALNMVGFLFATLLLPMFAHIKRTKEQNDLARIALLTISVIVTLATLACIFYASEIMSWLYIAADGYYTQVFRVLTGCFATISIAYVFGTMITASGNLKKLNIIYGLGIIVNWSLNMILIPKYLALGAAWTTLATQVFVLSGLMFLAVKDLRWQIDATALLKMLLFVVSSACLFYYLKSYLDWPWVMEMSFSVLLGILVSFLLRIVRLQYIKQIYR